MGTLTRDDVLKKAKAGEAFDRADLRGLDLSNAPLEGVDLRRADLEGANLENAKLRGANLRNASLREAYLAGADLRDVNLDKAELEGANLERAQLAGANLSRANLDGANLQSADLKGARLTNAQLQSANMGGANLSEANASHADFVETYLGGAILVNASLKSADLSGANLEEADLRNAELVGANLSGATLTGAKVDGAIAKEANLSGLIAEWVDASEKGDGSKRVEAAGVAALLLGTPAPAAPAPSAPAGTRYFGEGDVMRNASLEFGDGVRVQIESRFEQCSIALGKGAELTIGKAGVLARCQITGAGNITIHGQFFERESPGIVGPSQVVVSAGGALVGVVEQIPEATRFAFEPGCSLRMKILRARSGPAARAGEPEHAEAEVAKGRKRR